MMKIKWLHSQFIAHMGGKIENIQAKRSVLLAYQSKFDLDRGTGPNGEAVLHTMYMDGPCSRRWGDILRTSKSHVDRELKRALEYKFGRQVPDPLDTVYQYWDEGAW